METEIVTAILIAAVGLIGALVAWLGHRVLRDNAELSARISRENIKLSTSLEATKQLCHNRQMWIDHLRDDMAKYFALTLEPDDKKKEYNIIYEVGARIELRMNPADIDYATLRKAMRSCVELEDVRQIAAGRETYLSVCQIILKREWEVLKKELRDLPTNLPSDERE